MDLTILGSTAAALDPVGEAVETGAILLAGVIPSTVPAKPKAPLKSWAAPLLETWDRLGFPRERLGRRRWFRPRPAGWPARTSEWAVRAMTLSRELAEAIADLPEGW